MFMIDPGTESLYTKLGLSPDATAAQIRAACDDRGKQLTNELREAANDPERKKKIEARLLELNTVGEILRRPKKREQYDKEHSHLRFFMLQPVAAPMFIGKADRLVVLHRVLVEFLASKSVTISPLSDLARLDFTTDETPLELLDRLIV